MFQPCLFAGYFFCQWGYTKSTELIAPNTMQGLGVGQGSTHSILVRIHLKGPMQEFFLPLSLTLQDTDFLTISSIYGLGGGMSSTESHCRSVLPLERFSELISFTLL